MSYAGDLSPEEAWARLEAGAVLVDVRTEGEWARMGTPAAPSAAGRRQEPLFVQWTLAGGAPNPYFLEQLQQQAPDAASAELIFLCRSGARSVAGNSGDGSRLHLLQRPRGLRRRTGPARRTHRERLEKPRPAHQPRKALSEL